MLSIFPQLLPFSLLGIFIIRITIGLTLLFIASDILSKKRNDFIKMLKLKKFFMPEATVWLIGLTSIIVSFFMLAGFITQISAIISGYIFFNLMILDSENKIIGQTKIFYIIMSIISFSFLFLGPGLFSLDLPL